MKVKETVEKAYGSVAKEVSLNFVVDVFPFRGMKYYWLKIKRKFMRV